MTGLTALAARLRRQARILREAALLIRHALTALTARLSGELAVLGEAALLTRYALTAFAACLRGKITILRKAAFRIRDSLAAHTGDLPLTFLIHRGEPTIGSSTFHTSCLCHFRISFLVLRKFQARTEARRMPRCQKIEKLTNT